jgi:hypothetical protein
MIATLATPLPTFIVEFGRLGGLAEVSKDGFRQLFDECSVVWRVERKTTGVV